MGNNGSEEMLMSRSQQDVAGERARRQRMIEEAEGELGDLRSELSELTSLRTDLERVARDNMEQKRRLE